MLVLLWADSQRLVHLTNYPARLSYNLSCTFADGLISFDSWNCFHLLCRASPQQCDSVGSDWATVSGNPSEDFKVSQSPVHGR
jgi:hypothetical protein